MLIHVAKEVLQESDFLFKVFRVALQGVVMLASFFINILEITAEKTSMPCCFRALVYNHYNM